MRFATILFLLSCVTVFAAEDNWNQFRGPHGDGKSTAKGLPVKFGEGSPEIVWKTAVTGRAWSSPVCWEKQIWVTNAPEIINPDTKTLKLDKPLDKPLELSAVCIDLETGKIVLNKKLFEITEPQFTHPTNSYGSCTPYIEEGRIYIHFGSYGTACLDTETGEKVWERLDLKCDHWRGPGSSVAVYQGLVYLTFDGYDEQYIIALDKLTGKTVWRSNRDVDYGTDNGDAKKAYSTPILIESQGRELLISPFASATIAYNPRTGDRIWTIQHGGMNAAGRPLFNGGLLYIQTADGPNPLVVARSEGTGDITGNIVWKSGKSIPKRGSLIIVDDMLFMMNDEGVASCLDAKKGKELWTKRFNDKFWASPIYADGLIYCLSQTGTVLIFKASREFELVAENKLDDGFFASPAVAGRSLILRTEKNVYRIEKPGSSR